MSDETTGATNAPASLTTPVGTGAVPATDNSAGTTATAANGVDEMAQAFDAMPPLDQIEVPGGEPEPRRGGRNNRRGANSDGDGSELRAGQVVTGTVVHIDHEGVLVDVGMKSEGLIRPNELSRETVQNIEDVVKVGDKIDVLVLDSERGDSNLLLSKKRADFEKAWDRVQEALADGRTVMAMVSDRVKGGLVVDLGIRGFVPASHVGNGKLKNLDKFVGTSVPLKVLEVDRQNRKVVLSHRLATEEERENEKTNTIQSLAEGQTRRGVIRRVTDYGAFVDLGGIDGLLHVSEMSWTRVKHPSDVVKVGQEVDVMILRLNLDQGRVSLGMRQILPDPWLDAASKFHVNDVVEGEVTRLVPFGAFVLLEGGVEGIIPNSELSHRRIAKPSDVVEQGQMVQVKIIDIRADERRLTLSLRALQPRDAEEPRAPRTVTGTEPAPTTEGGTGDRSGRGGRGGRGRGGRGRDDEEGGDYGRYVADRGDSSGGGFTIGDMFPELLSASGRTTSGGKGKKGRRRPEEEDDIENFEDDFDPNAEPAASADEEETE